MTRRKDQREMERIHPDMMPEDWMEDGKITKEAAYRNYQRLDQAEKDKDTEHMNAMANRLNTKEKRIDRHVCEITITSKTKKSGTPFASWGRRSWKLQGAYDI